MGSVSQEAEQGAGAASQHLAGAGGGSTSMCSIRAATGAKATVFEYCARPRPQQDSAELAGYQRRGIKYFQLSKFHMSKWKEKTVPSLIRLGTIPPSTSRYIRGKPILNHVTVEIINSRVSTGSISKDEEEGAGARPCSALEPHDRRAGVADFQHFSALKILRAAPRWHVLSI